MSTLDPNPDNELGTGTLDPAIERWLIGRNAVFARTVTLPTGKSLVEFSCRPIVNALTDAVIDARRRLNTCTTLNVSPLVQPIDK